MKWYHKCSMGTLAWRRFVEVKRFHFIPFFGRFLYCLYGGNRCYGCSDRHSQGVCVSIMLPFGLLFRSIYWREINAWFFGFFSQWLLPMFYPYILWHCFLLNPKSTISRHSWGQRFMVFLMHAHHSGKAPELWGERPAVPCCPICNISIAPSLIFYLSLLFLRQPHHSFAKLIGICRCACKTEPLRHSEQPFRKIILPLPLWSLPSCHCEHWFHVQWTLHY